MQTKVSKCGIAERRGLLLRRVTRAILLYMVSLLLTVSLPGCTGCGDSLERPDTSGHEVTLRLRPFYRDLCLSSTPLPSRVEELQREYGDYFTTFCSQELRVGRPGDEGFYEHLQAFLGCPENLEVLPACDSVFARLDIDRQASEAFSCFAALLPDATPPRELLCHFCGFNDRILVDSTYISFAIEHYLGSGCRFYEWLEIPQYARRTKSSRYIVGDLLKAWLYANYPETSQQGDLLTALIYQGRILYASHRCQPAASAGDILGFDECQQKWCEANEARMWGYLVEHKLLYSTDMLDIAKVVNDAPFTSFFGNQSPGRAALWCAYHIVRGYAERNPDTALSDILGTLSAQKLLQGSRYNP